MNSAYAENEDVYLAVYITNSSPLIPIKSSPPIPIKNSPPIPD
ncbi:hypothetical protein [Acinetobacter johnsonii]